MSNNPKSKRGNVRTGVTATETFGSVIITATDSDNASSLPIGSLRNTAPLKLSAEKTAELDELQARLDSGEIKPIGPLSYEEAEQLFKNDAAIAVTNFLSYPPADMK